MRKSKKPKLIYSKSNEVFERLEAKPFFTNVQSPHLLFSSGDIQTISAALPVKVNFKYTTHMVEIFDGEKIKVDLADANSTNIVLFFPGLTSTIESFYLHKFMESCLQNNYNVGLINHRGYGVQKIEKDRLYTPSDFRDFKAV